jgi:hypothetical protein
MEQYPRIIILISIGIVIGSLCLAYSEISEAKHSCDNIYSNYTFSFSRGHLCNNQTYIKYNNGWDFSREINYSKLFP